MITEVDHFFIWITALFNKFNILDILFNIFETEKYNLGNPLSSLLFKILYFSKTIEIYLFFLSLMVLFFKNIWDFYIKYDISVQFDDLQHFYWKDKWSFITKADVWIFVFLQNCSRILNSWSILTDIGRQISFWFLP